MGKKYYGGIGTDKGFVMHSPESKYHYSPDDEFHKEGDKGDVGSASNTGGGSSSNNDSTHNESSDKSADESRSSAQSNFDAPYNDDRNNRDGELDDFFGDLLSIKACIALAIEGLFKAFMSRSMKRIDFVAVTLMLLVCMRVDWRGVHRLELFERTQRLCLRGGAECARHVHDFRKMPGQRAYGTRNCVLAGPHRSRHRMRSERLRRRRVQPHHELGAGWLSGQRSSSDCGNPN